MDRRSGILVPLASRVRLSLLQPHPARAADPSTGRRPTPLPPQSSPTGANTKNRSPPPPLSPGARPTRGRSRWPYPRGRRAR